ncbi:hypothetical protein, partial [Gelidibacter salicanalis]|uniref:hypothetical protein n=1 Tax=Gelidibacter salicanalis TaxID=291193 RepID=UPI001F33251B
MRKDKRGPVVPRWIKSTVSLHFFWEFTDTLGMMPTGTDLSQVVERATRHLNKALKSLGRTLDTILQEDNRIQLSERVSLKDEHKHLNSLHDAYEEALAEYD